MNRQKKPGTLQLASLGRLLTWNLEAPDERIASETRVATADGTVVDRFASRVYATNTRTRVHAFPVLASAIRGAIRADRALRSTHGWAPHERG